LNKSLRIESKTFSKEIEKNEFGSKVQESIQIVEVNVSSCIFLGESKNRLKRRYNKDSGKDKCVFASAKVNPEMFTFAAFKEPTNV
jgi:hypothetical protein